MSKIREDSISVTYSETSEIADPGRTRLTCEYGFMVFTGIIISYLSLTAIVIYFGFWLNLDTDDPVILVLVGGGTYSNPHDDKSDLTAKVEQHFLPSTSLLLNPTCREDEQDIVDFPLPTKGAVGAILPSNRIMICAGCCPLNNECYIFNQNKNVWNKGQSLSTPRAFAASANVSDGWWVTGGITIRGHTKGTEILQDKKWLGGPELPRAVAKHCLVSINLTHTLLIGGESENSPYSVETWMHRWTHKDEWTRLANMIEGRRNHACTFFEQKGKVYGVLVAGGEGKDGKVLDSTEIFEISTGHWKQNFKLPIPITNASFASSYGKPVLVGGSHSNSIIAFEQHAKNPHWYTMDKRLHQAREAFVGLMARESALPQCREKK